MLVTHRDPKSPVKTIFGTTQVFRKFLSSKGVGNGELLVAPRLPVEWGIWMPLAPNRPPELTS